MFRTIGLVGLVALVLASSAIAAGAAPYRTETQAETFLKTKLASWSGIDLTSADFKSAFCMNGYYSRVEKRTGKHYPQEHRNGAGEDIYRSFSCSLVTSDHDFNLYVVTLPGGNWRIRADL